MYMPVNNGESPLSLEPIDPGRFTFSDAVEPLSKLYDPGKIILQGIWFDPEADEGVGQLAISPDMTSYFPPEYGIVALSDIVVDAAVIQTTALTVTHPAIEAGGKLPLVKFNEGHHRHVAAALPGRMVYVKSRILERTRRGFSAEAKVYNEAGQCFVLLDSINGTTMSPAVMQRALGVLSLQSGQTATSL